MNLFQSNKMDLLDSLLLKIIINDTSFFMILKNINIRVRLPKWVFSWVLLFSDSIIGFIIFYSVIFPSLSVIINFSFGTALVYITIQFFWYILFYLNHLYLGEYTISRIAELIRLFRIIGLVIGFYIIITAVGFTHEFIRPAVMLNYGIMLCIFTCCNRILLRSFQKWLLKKGIGRENTVIIGANERGKKAVQFFHDHRSQGFNILGFIHLDGESNSLVKEMNILGHIDNIKKIVQNENVSDIVLALNDNQRSQLFSIVQKLDSLPVTIKVIPDLYEVISGITRTQQISGLPLININLKLETNYLIIYKPIYDFIFSFVFIIVTLPVWIIIAILIKIDSKGSILYKQKRVGKHNSVFYVYKFRSMVQDAEKQTGPVWANKKDSRITNAGKILRRFRLDELPQLLNVLKGEMSIIGPRPERPFFVEQLIKEFPFYMRRSKVRPGITGWAQIKHPYDEKLEDVREKLRYDFYYIENVDIWLDIKIILATFWVMVSGKGR
ncbi:MAG: exopolysaccharide biosynthesis polyprenyl glycosylphosphotransferase [Candidatus Marinimicrobia bacterium]|nr:exopolysaccharide biosynthesis polyprenyl glycosylphosphotransferase [Candidatus Neomarinimicrobiota bacterium]